MAETSSDGEEYIPNGEAEVPSSSRMVDGVPEGTTFEIETEDVPELINEHGWNMLELRKLKAGLSKFGFNLKRLEGLIKTKTKDQIVQYIQVLREKDIDGTASGKDEVRDEEEFRLEGEMDLPEGPEKWLMIIDRIREAYVNATGGHGDLSNTLIDVFKQLSSHCKKQHCEMPFSFPRQGGETSFHFSEIYDYLAWISQDPEKRGEPVKISPFAYAIISRMVEDLEEEVADGEAPELDEWLKVLEGKVKQGDLNLSVPSSNSSKHNYLDFLSFNPLLIPVEALQKSVQKKETPPPPMKRSADVSLEDTPESKVGRDEMWLEVVVD